MFPIAFLTAGILRLSNNRLESVCEGGAEKLSVRTFAPLDHAASDTISFLAQAAYLHQVKDCKAAVVVLRPEDKKALWGDVDPGRPLILTENPYAWFAWALQVITQEKVEKGYVDPRAVVEAGAQVDPSARIEPYAVVKKGARIDARVHLYPGTYVGENTQIGADSILYSNAVVYHGCHIGQRCILHSSCVIGADGFGFAPFRGEYVKIPQLGGVTLGNDVEVGASTTIDRGALEDTRVGDGTKLDNQIQLGHNDQIGCHTVMAACTGVAGSAKIGSHCMIGGGAGVNGHISIPDGSAVGPFTGVLSWKKGTKELLGYFPAQERRDFDKTAVLIRRLPCMREQLRVLQDEVDQLKRALVEKESES